MLIQNVLPCPFLYNAPPVFVSYYFKHGQYPLTDILYTDTAFTTTTNLIIERLLHLQILKYLLPNHYLSTFLELPRGISLVNENAGSPSICRANLSSDLSILLTLRSKCVHLICVLYKSCASATVCK